ncbi:hypothetical protein [Gluconacetobacter tumulisoli]|uniref:pEK499-p136 HEPN domain-containing protein n=1 Tax=Gluconacetobacter tumulisoli TaxID=1286189 RepID=A0A7W4K902_9PROT|nr:hypothetical protein [Gluconacetobacter tumulisoli]MBB2202566.1 hypothetical protein [Gluconacetobacter tumulisoli]
MGIPSDPLLDIMRRSLINLDFIEANYQNHGLYEVAQLVNTFLGAFIHPFEKSAKGKEFIRYFRERPPPVPFETKTIGNLNYLEFIYFVRHALAHGDLHYNANKIKQIESITLWNTKYKENPVRITLSIRDMKVLLLDFKNGIEEMFEI